MRRIDEAAIHTCGIASITLMENAGLGVAEEAARLLGRVKNKRICTICGKGNNGGDGLVASRHLYFRGYDLDIFALSRISKLGRDGAFNLRLLRRNGRIVKEILDAEDVGKIAKNFDYGLVIDALFGTGFSGPTVCEPAKTVISLINSSDCRTVSVDIPSGLDGATGLVRDRAVRADVTVTMSMPKRGFFLNDGPSCAGEVVVKNIGLPSLLLDSRRR